MRAVFVEQADPTAPLSALRVGERPEPEVPEGWVKVQVEAAGLNHHDLWSLRGVGLREEALPMLLGCDAAGLDEDGNEKRHGFIIIAGSGFDAEIMMKAAPTKNDIGEIAYFLSALATPNPTVAHFTIEHDGIVEELDGICCMAGNTSVIQNDINLFPDCRMNDGMVDIAVIEPVKTVQLLPTVITAALDPAGKVLGRPQFKIIQTKEAKITCTPSLGMQFDGEIISSNSGVFGARALPQCLDLIVDEFSPLGK